MVDSRTGFVVLYRWRVRDGLESEFVRAWEVMTDLIRRHQGGRGSRLHRGDDGLYYAYAQWPDRATWESPGPLPPEAAPARAAMNAAIAERLDPLLLEPVGDLLLPE